MNFDPVVWSIPLFFVLIGIELVFDFVKRKRTGEGFYRLNDAFSNISCGVVDQSTGLFAKVLVIGIYAAAYEYIQPLTPWEIQGSIPIYIVFFFAVDLAYYWAHRLSHQVNLFWTGHVIHHQSEDYNLSVALRQGAFQKLFTFWVYLPLAIIGFPPEWFLVTMGFNLLYQFWIHTEWVKKMGPFEYVLNTPSHHRVHHGRNPKYIDRNHAGVFIIWDRMFGTFQAEEEHPTYGITQPVNTFNPVLAYIQPFQLLIHDLRQINGFRDKVRFLFASPGWYPEQLGGVKPPPPITGDEKKYDQELPIGLNVYLLIQYAFFIAVSASVLLNIQGYSQPDKALFVLFALFQVFSMGFVFDRSRKGVILESMRLIVFLAFGCWMALMKDQITFAAVIIVFGLLSTAWLAILKSRGRFNG